jgi:hypothetical protein
MTDDLRSKLLTEAFLLGAGLLPIYIMTHKIVGLMLPRMSDETQDYLSIFLSGATFHLVAEGTGINDWYLENGHAYLKRNRDAEFLAQETAPDDLCDGRCGWESMGGLCSHYSLHQQGQVPLPTW